MDAGSEGDDEGGITWGDDQGDDPGSEGDDQGEGDDQNYPGSEGDDQGGLPGASPWGEIAVAVRFVALDSKRALGIGLHCTAQHCTQLH